MGNGTQADHEDRGLSSGCFVYSVSSSLVWPLLCMGAEKALLPVKNQS